MSNFIYLTNVDDAGRDEKCGMSYWLATQEGGTGISRKQDIIPNAIESAFHEDLKTLSKMEDISPAAVQSTINDILSSLTSEDKADVRRMELLYRRLGWFASFAMFREPEIRDEYETLTVDDEIIYPHEPLWGIAKPDRVLKGLASGDVVYREYVAMDAGLTNRNWLQSWHYNIRLHLGLGALQNTFGTKLNVSFGQVMGLAKGYYSSVGEKRLVHPFVYGYYNKEKDSWTNSFMSSESGWTQRPIWEFEPGIVQWVRMCGDATASTQFPVSPPVYLDQRILDEWCMKRLHRERELRTIQTTAAKNHSLRAVYFGRSTANCRPNTGEACPFLHACWIPNLSKNPLIGGEYERNEAG